jgi:excisionase family DNA binding protein
MAASDGSAGVVRFLTRTEVARVLGVSPNTVSRWAREGRLPCQMTLGGHRRFDRAVVEEIRRRMSGVAAPEQ